MRRTLRFFNELIELSADMLFVAAAIVLGAAIVIAMGATVYLFGKGLVVLYWAIYFGLSL